VIAPTAGSCLLAGLLGIAVLLASAPATGRAPSPAADSAFEAGVALTREGQFEAALSRFLAAEAAGDRSARLYFNLGVVHYRLGRFDAARDAFGLAALEPETADLARYNLGLVAMAIDHRLEAMQWFGQVAREAQEPALRQLALVAQERVQGRSADLPTDERGSLSLLRAWDSNVIVPVGTLSDVPSSRHDEFLEARALWSDAIGTNIEGLGYRVSGVAIEYDQVHEADVLAAEAAVDWRGPFLVEAALGAFAVDDKGYQRTLDVRLQVPVVARPWARLDADAGWSRYDPLDSRAAGLEGSRYAYGASLTTGRSSFNLSVGYRHLINDRFASALSPSQDRYHARLRHEIGRWSWRLWGRYTDSDYPSQRHDEASDWGLEIAWRLHRHWELLLEGSRLKNRSTDERLEYVSERLYAGMRLRF
jgi:hypothetical protein